MVLKQANIYMQKKESRYRPYTLHKINKKWIMDPNVTCKIIKLLEDNIGKNLDDLGYGNDTLVQHQRWHMKVIIFKLEFIQMNVKRMRTQATNWEKIFAKDRYDKGLFKIYYTKYSSDS